MSDIREPLPSGFCLDYGGSSYTICSEIDRGASCIVYDALYFDEENQQHHVRIKELYPYHLKISRRADGCLDAADKAKFAEEEHQLVTAYKRNSELKKTIGMTNSTVNPIGIIKANNTRYIITDFIEGKNYCEECDENIRTVFVRMLALARKLREFHNKGYLYLDIKPSNILVIPETAEHIYFFDFDSLLLKSDISSGNVKRISFSNGFSAPELVRRKIQDLCDGTDFYSVGAVVYYKLFGTAPGLSAVTVSSRCDFSSLKFKETDSELLRKLEVFFKKTLTPSVLTRYRSDDELICALEELVLLSDEKHPYLVDSFTYISGNFVGREKELAAIDAGIRNNHAVFVSGIGGIGKTELVRYYAHTHQEDFRHILFVSYTGDIISTFCKKDIFIKDIKQGTEENDEDFYKRKLEIFTEITDEKDLFILDNFDSEDLDEINDLLKCSCSFIITTRTDFHDYNIFQVDIRSFDNMNTLLELFRLYDPIEYSDEESASVIDLIELVERHTMTVELIAKYLRITEALPSKLFVDIAEKEGITNTDNTGIKQRKDSRMCESDMVTHLLFLFDLSGFTESQCEVIKSLSLLGYVKIRREKFIALCPMEGCMEDIDHLVRSGWIQSDDRSGKIHLHQIILDLVYNKLDPTTNSCPHITVAIDDSIKSSYDNQYEQNIRNKVAETFISRVTGTDLAYANLLTDYCCKINQGRSYNENITESLLEKACTICIESDDPAADEILYRIYIRQIEAFLGDWSLCDSYTENEIAEMAISLSDKAIAAAKRISDAPGFLADSFINVSNVLSEYAENAFIFDESIKKQIFDAAEGLLMQAEQYISDDIPCEHRAVLYNRIQAFYSDNDYGFHPFLTEHYKNNAKALHYQHLIEELEGPDRSENDLTSIRISGNFAAFYEDEGDAAMKKGDYRSAFEMYELALDTPYHSSLIHEKLADCSIALGDPQEAVRRLRKIVDNSDEIWFDYSECIKLMTILFDIGDLEECQKYSEILLAKCRNNGIDDEYAITGNYYLYKLEKDDRKRKSLWDNCCSMFRSLDTLPIDQCIEGFVIEYSERIEELSERMDLLMDTARNMYSYNDDCRIYEYVAEKCDGKKELLKYRITALLEHAKIIISREDNAKALCKAAERDYISSGVRDEMLKDKMYFMIGDCMNDMFLNEEARNAYRKCNIFSFSEREALGCDDEKKLGIWISAADKFSWLEDYKMEETCYDIVMQVIRRNINKAEFCYYDKISNTIYDMITVLNLTGNHEKLCQLMSEIYPHILYYYDELYEDLENDKIIRCFDNICMLAFYLDLYDAYRVNLVLLMASVIILTGGKADAATVQSAIRNDNAGFDKLVAGFKAALKIPVTPLQIDNILKIRNVVEQKKEIVPADILEALEEFSLAYEKADIEYKR